MIELNTITNRTTKSSTDCKSSSAELNFLCVQLDEITTKLALHQASLDKLKATLESQKQQLVQKQSDFKAVRQQLVSDNNLLKAELLQLQDKETNLRATLSNETAETNNVSANIATLELANTTKQQQHSQFINEVSALEQQQQQLNDTIERKRQEKAKLEQQAEQTLATVEHNYELTCAKMKQSNATAAVTHELKHEFKVKTAEYDKTVLMQQQMLAQQQRDVTNHQTMLNQRSIDNATLNVKLDKQLSVVQQQQVLNTLTNETTAVTARQQALVQQHMELTTQLQTQRNDYNTQSLQFQQQIDKLQRQYDEHLVQQQENTKVITQAEDNLQQMKQKDHLTTPEAAQLSSDKSLLLQVNAWFRNIMLL